MKKIFSTLVTLILVLSTLFTFTACGSDQQKLVGTWKAEMDFGKIMDEQMGSEKSYFAGLELTVFMTFEKDGSFKMGADKDDNKDFENDFKKGMEKYLNDIAAAQGVTLDDVLALQDMTLDELISQTIDVDELFKEFDESGDYKAEDGKLYLDSEDEYEEYELDGDTLKLTGSSEEEEDANFIYPLIFKKQ